MRFGLVAFVCAGVLASRPMHAQRVDSLPLGVRVTVMLKDSLCVARELRCDRRSAVVGSLTGVTPTGLAVQLGESGAITLERRTLQSVYVSRGRSRWRTSLRAAVGTGVAAALIVAGSDASGQSTLKAGAFGAAAGLSFGALYPVERWRRISLEK